MYHEKFAYILVGVINVVNVFQLYLLIGLTF